ncbi:MAG: LysR family transcriptional regulator [Desulfobacterales bacterium RIFOXYA12_FULL_46_15]|nr:MAG: LysR family transcriptional regulator [Desulfobacula sp. GWF2_41_7]OGR25688.1 MAG: LysR family transcriptional regulator [Desulfobacterales bacterium RIFOXYA12_FULL_46_15]
MDLWQLKIFVAVVENKSFSKASEAINLSQPTVSSHIKELEDYFKCRLLDRLGKITEPTKAGEILYLHAKKILSLKDQTETAMYDFLGKAKGSLALGGSTIPSGYILPKIIGPFSKKFPEIHIELFAGDTTQIIEEIKKGRIEVGIVGAKTDDPLVSQEEFVMDEMRLIIPSGHKWADKTSVSLPEVLKETLIAREKGSGTWQSILKSMARAGFDPKTLNAPVTMGNTISVIQGILHHVGISILSTIAVQDDIDKGRLKALSVTDLDLNRFFYLTTSRKRSGSPISKKFIEFARISR